jgi:hypothetical protein
MVGMAPPLLVVTPTKGHVGWDEPVQDPDRAFKWQTPASQWQLSPGQHGKNQSDWMVQKGLGRDAAKLLGPAARCGRLS